ncbi:MAG: ABC transporter substrate-binding protein [Phototrophicaceae bacterium]
MWRNVRIGWLISLVLLLALTPALAQDDTLTVQADADLEAALGALADAFDGVTLEFVDADADLLATTDLDAAREAAGGLPAHFLHEAALVALTDDAAAQDFVRFAVSPDGQQALIDGEFLPAVVTVTDQAGVEHEIAQPVYTLLSPYSVATYLVYGVGGADRLVGAGYLGARDPLGAASMERIDPRFPELSGYALSQTDVNVEEVASLDPQVVLTSTRSEWLDVIQSLDIDVVVFEGESPELLKESMLITGAILGPNTLARAEAWVEYYDTVFADVVAVTSELEADELVSVLFTGTNALRVASGQMYQTDMIEAAGGVSVSAELGGFWNDVNLEQILLWQPDVIFVPPYGGASVEAITDSSEWQILDAVQEDRVYLLPKLVAPWDTPVPDSVLGIIWMANILYPGLLDYDCEAEVTSFYQTFYDYEVTAEELSRLCAS